MKRIFVDFTIVSGIVLLLFFTFLQVNYIGMFEKIMLEAKVEERLGNLIWESIKSSNSEVESEELYSAINTIKDRICDENQINSYNIKIHIVYNSEVNAFALPNHHMVIYTGLITSCDSPEELAAVMSHEIAHMELKHVMKKLSKEMGITMLAMMLGGNNGIAFMKEIAQMISSTAYSRKYEREADAKAVEYLENANIDPTFFSIFLNKLESKEAIPSQLYWLSTHPNSEERALTILKLKKKNSYPPTPIFTPEEWIKIKEMAVFEYDGTLESLE